MNQMQIMEELLYLESVRSGQEALKKAKVKFIRKGKKLIVDEEDYDLAREIIRRDSGQKGEIKFLEKTPDLEEEVEKEEDEKKQDKDQKKQKEDDQKKQDEEEDS